MKPALRKMSQNAPLNPQMSEIAPTLEKNRRCDLQKSQEYSKMDNFSNFSNFGGSILKLSILISILLTFGKLECKRDSWRFFDFGCDFGTALVLNHTQKYVKFLPFLI